MDNQTQVDDPPMEGPQDFSFIDAVSPEATDEPAEAPVAEDTPVEEVPDTPQAEEPSEEAADTDPLDELQPDKGGDAEPTEETKTGSPLDEFPEAEDLEVLDEPAKAKWGELRSELDQALQANEELKNQMESSPLNEEYNQLKEQYSEMQRQLAAYDVETSPEYQEAVGQPLDAIMDAAAAIAERTEGIDANDLHMVLAMDGSPQQNEKLSEAANAMDEHDKFAFYRMVQDASVLLQKDRMLRDNAAVAAVELEEAKANQRTLEQQENMKEVHKALAPVFDKLTNILEDSENVDLTAIKKEVLKENLFELDPAGQAYAMTAAHLNVPLLKELRASRAEIAKLKKEVGSMIKSDPSVSPNRDYSSDSNKDEGGSFFDAIDKQLRDSGR